MVVAPIRKFIFIGLLYRLHVNQKTGSTGDNDNKYPVCVCECDCRDKRGYMTLAHKRVIRLVFVDDILMHKITKCCKHFASCKL